MSKTDAKPLASTTISSPYPSAGIGWYSTILLAFLYWLSILDRTIISLLVDPIKTDLGITDVQFGMLHGLAFAVAFSLFGLAAGSLADRLNRRLVIFFSVSVWSLATAACGLAKDFGHLLIARVGVGVGEAGLNPCATSMITDLFPPQRRTMAMAIYAMGASVGAGCAYLFGGMLVDAVQQAPAVVLPVLGELKPWQTVFLIIGIPGVLLSFLSFTMPEPARRGVQHAQQSTPWFRSLLQSYPALLRFMRARGKFFFFHYLGFGLASIGFVGGVAWYPAHMARTFGWTSSEIGLGLGVAMIFGGVLGKPLCGYFVDSLFRRGYMDAHFRWYAGCLIVATPIGLVAATSDIPWVFLGGYALFQLLLGPVTAVYVASLNLVTPNELRGAGVAFYSATVGLIALSVGPIMIAVLSDYVYGGDAIGLGIATMFAICLPLAAFFLLRGRSAMCDAVTAAQEWEPD
ncbi:MAG: MFS transporter [Halioglobus sp.]|nr:MFS transporter [Halioglobus sp.]